jgi:hypothetical protein
MQRFFRVTQPTVHQMILALEKRGAVSRVPGRARSIRLLVLPEEVPMLKEISFRGEDGECGTVRQPLRGGTAPLGDREGEGV